jgi:hypothetical protein
VKRKPKRSSLPRVTVLAYSRRDLAAFVERIDALINVVNDLRLQVDRLTRVPGRVRPKLPAANGEGS